MPHLLFSFGTLRQPDVQLALYGTRLPSTPDTIAGYVVGRVRVTDPAVVEASGSDVHPALVATGTPTDVVPGVVLELDDAQLAATDRYEQGAFRRITVTTAAGHDAWAFVPKPGLPVLEADAGGRG